MNTRTHSVRAASAALALGWSSLALAQQPQAAAVGTAFDSVRLKPLAGARIRVDSSSVVATADDNGAFRIVGITPGQHYLAVEHPILDTLGIKLRSSLDTYAAGETKAVEIASPASEALIGLFCAPAWRARGPAALVGRVSDAETGAPATGAKVSLVWYELEVKGSVRRAPRVREITVGPDGMYRMCGLPPAIEARVQVIQGTLTSGDVGIAFGEDLLVLRSLSIALPSAVAAVPEPRDSTVTDSGKAVPSTAITSTTPATRSPARVKVTGVARLTGRVLNKTGKPLVGARVQLEGTTRAAVTRTTGEFVLDSLPSGTQTVTARLLGYAPVEAAVDLSSREARTVTLTMEDFIPTLETVRVNAQRDRALDQVGFAARKRSGQGYYMDEDDIKRRNALMFSDVLRTAPGIKVTQSMGRNFIENSRDPVRGCVNVWVDGTMWQQLEPGDIDDFVKPWEIGAIEVYSSSTTPVEFQRTGQGCATVVAWTTRRLDRKR